jgi:hypothetical protein
VTRIERLVVPSLIERTLRPQFVTNTEPDPRDPLVSPSFFAPTHRKVAAAAGGIGVIGVGVGSVFSLRAISKSDESERLGCIGALCPTQRGVEARRQAEVSANVATAAMITGLVGLTTAAILFLFVDGGQRRAALPFLPVASPAPGQLGWQHSF